MIEPKSLKDLNLYQCLEDYPRKDLPIEDLVVDVEELKQVAIKDIKFLRHMKEQSGIKLLPWITTTDFENTGLNAIIEYIKWKFNLLEEDLR